MEKNKKRKLISKMVSNFNHKIDPEQLSKGIDSEKEHDDGKSTNVTNHNKKKIAKIAIAHLKEDPQYYSHLSSMEKKYAKK